MLDPLHGADTDAQPLGDLQDTFATSQARTDGVLDFPGHLGPAECDALRLGPLEARQDAV